MAAYLANDANRANLARRAAATLWIATAYLLTCAALFGAILAPVMPKKPLSEEMIQVAEGKVEVPEY